MKIKVNGIKARDIEVDLETYSILSAPNGTGKSAVADAIRFAALGYVPALGKRPQDTAAILRNGSGGAEVVLDDGRTIARSISRRGKTLVRDATASWCESDTTGEHSAAILRLFGGEESEVAESLDIRELLSATPSHRAARIEAMLDAGAPDTDELIEAVERRQAQRLAGVEDDRIPEDWRHMIPMIKPEQAKARVAAGDMLAAKVGEGLAEAGAWANEGKRDAARIATSKKKAAEELRARVEELPEPSNDRIAEYQGELAAAQQEQGAAIEREEARLRNAQLAQAAQANLDRTQAAHIQSAADLLELEKIAGDGVLLDAKRDALAAELVEIAEPAQPDTTEIAEADELRMKARALDEKILAKKKSAPKSRIVDVASPSHAVMTLKADLVRLEKDPLSAVRSLVASLELALGQTADPEVFEIIGEIHKKLSEAGVGARTDDEIRADICEAEAVLAAKIAESEDEAATMVLANKEIEKLRADVGGIRSREAIVRNNALQTYSQAMAEANANRARLIGQIEKIDAVRKKQLGDLADIRQTHALRSGDVREAQARIDGIQSQAEPPADDGLLESMAGRINIARSGLDEMRRAEGARTELQRLVSALDALQANREVYAATEWAIQRVREAQISAAGGPIVATMAMFLGGADYTELPYLRASRGTCEVGWRKTDGAEIPVQALSGGEWVLFAAALTAAVLADRKGATLRILLVEAGECDEAHLDSLLDGIRAVGDRITHAIVMVYSAQPERPGWNVVKI